MNKRQAESINANDVVYGWFCAARAKKIFYSVDQYTMNKMI